MPNHVRKTQALVSIDIAGVLTGFLMVVRRAAWFVSQIVSQRLNRFLKMSLETLVYVTNGIAGRPPNSHLQTARSPNFAISPADWLRLERTGFSLKLASGHFEAGFSGA